MKLAIAINYVDYTNADKKERQNVAISVLVKNRPKNSILASFNFPEDQVDVPPVFSVFKMLQGDAQKDLGNNRRMPYVREILDLCSGLNCDVFGYMNSDILLSKDFFSVFKHPHDAFVFLKKDIEKVGLTDFLNGNIKIVNENPYGVDAVFFNTKWWKSHRGLFPSKIVLGETEWDTCYNATIQKDCQNYALERSLYHPYHDRIWTIDSRAAIHNALIWDAVRKRCGLPMLTPENKGAS